MSIFRAAVDESTDILPTEDVSVILKNVVVFMMPIEFLAELRTFSSNWKQAQPETERIIKIKFTITKNFLIMMCYINNYIEILETSSQTLFTCAGTTLFTCKEKKYDWKLL